MPELEYTSKATGNQVTEGDRFIGEKDFIDGLSIEDIKSQVLACQTQAEEEYREIRDKWQDCWDVVNCIHDDSYLDKEDWQAQVFMPEAGPTVRKASSIIRRILMRTGRMFDLKNDDIPPEWVSGQLAAIEYHIQRMIGDKTREDLPLIDCFMESVESGFTFGLWVLKLWWSPRSRSIIEYSPADTWQTEESIDRVTKKTGGLAGRVVDPRHFWFDYDHSFYIEETWSDLPELRRLAEAGIYDTDQVEKLKFMDYGPSDDTEDERLESMNLNRHPNPFRKKVHIYEFWGDLYRYDGTIFKRNARVVLANKTTVLNPDDMNNPFWHARPPYIVGGPIKAIFRKEGKSIVDDMRTLQRAINNLVNMSLDGLLYRLLKPMWMDPDSLRDPDQARDLKPGAVLMVNHAGQQPIGEIEFSDLPAGSLKELEVLRRGSQNASQVVDPIMGAHPLRPGTTATEVSIQTAESNDTFEGYSRNIEEQLIEPSIDMVRLLLVQYWRDFEDPALQTIVQKYNLPWQPGAPLSRVQFLAANTRASSRGISSFFEKHDKLKNLLNFMKIIGGVPQFIQRIQLRELLDRILLNSGLQEVEKLLVAPEMEAMLQQQEMMMQQMAMRQQMMGGQPPQGQPGPPQRAAPPQQPPPQLPPPQGPGGQPMEAVMDRFFMLPPQQQMQIMSSLPPEYQAAFQGMVGGGR